MPSSKCVCERDERKKREEWERKRGRRKIKEKREESV